MQHGGGFSTRKNDSGEVFQVLLVFNQLGFNPKLTQFFDVGLYGTLEREYSDAHSVLDPAILETLLGAQLVDIEPLHG